MAQDVGLHVILDAPAAAMDPAGLPPIAAHADLEFCNCSSDNEDDNDDSSECTEDGDVYLRVQQGHHPAATCPSSDTRPAALNSALRGATTNLADHQQRQHPHAPAIMDVTAQQQAPNVPSLPQLLTAAGLPPGMPPGFIPLMVQPAYRLIGYVLTDNGYTLADWYSSIPPAMPSISEPSVSPGRAASAAASRRSQHKRQRTSLKRSPSVISTANTA